MCVCLSGSPAPLWREGTFSSRRLSWALPGPREPSPFPSIDLQGEVSLPPPPTPLSFLGEMGVSPPHSDLIRRCVGVFLGAGLSLVGKVKPLKSPLLEGGSQAPPPLFPSHWELAPPFRQGVASSPSLHRHVEASLGWGQPSACSLGEGGLVVTAILGLPLLGGMDGP